MNINTSTVRRLQFRLQHGHPSETVRQTSSSVTRRINVLLALKFADDTSLEGLVTNSDESKYCHEVAGWCRGVTIITFN